MKCSAVIPVFNEAESLATLHRELRETEAAHRIELEIVLVDDGSTDRSWEVIESLAANDPGVAAIRLRRNFGKAAALTAGFREASGEIVLTLDADLQDHPKEIPRFVAAIAEGHDVVSGWKAIRHDPWHKTLPSRVFNRLVGRVTGVRLHDHNCGFKAYRREVLDEISLYGELHRFVPVLAAARGFRVGEIPVEHRARRFGRSKYGIERFLKGLLDLLTVFFLTGYRTRPQHLLGGVGLLSFSLGAVGMAYLAVYWLLREYGGFGEAWLPLHQRPLVLYSLGAVLLGAQLLSVGFLAELVTAQHARTATNYSVRRRIAVRGPARSPTTGPPIRFDDLEDPAGLHRETPHREASEIAERERSERGSHDFGQEST